MEKKETGAFSDLNIDFELLQALIAAESGFDASAVSPETFMKTIQYQRVTKEGLRQLQPIVESISDAEGLDAHKRSVQIRFESGTQS